MNRIFLAAICIFVLSLSCGCASAQKPSLLFKPGVVVETLSAAASFSISKGEQGMGSNGYLLYQRPDRMRLVILSPFGTTVMEAVVAGTFITIIDNSKGVAYAGNLEELPRQGQGETWRNARWVMDTERPGSFVGDGSLERINSMGDRERATFENGLIVSKSLANGDMVRYIDYQMVNGVPLATEIIMNSHDGGRFRIKVTEPEVNAELAAEAFIPHLEGLTLFPLSALQEP